MRNTYIYPPHPSMRIIGQPRGGAGGSAGQHRHQGPGQRLAEVQPCALWSCTLRRRGSERPRCSLHSLPPSLAPPPGDIFAYCSKRLPKFHPISISGYHMQARPPAPARPPTLAASAARHARASAAAELCGACSAAAAGGRRRACGHAGGGRNRTPQGDAAPLLAPCRRLPKLQLR